MNEKEIEIAYQRLQDDIKSFKLYDKTYTRVIKEGELIPPSNEFRD